MRIALVLVSLTALLTGCTSLQIPQQTSEPAKKAAAPMPPLKPIRSLDDFLKSPFCAAYKCRFKDSWRTKNGNIEEIYETTMRDDDVWTEKRSGKLVSLGMIVGNHGGWSPNPDEYLDGETWKYIDDFLAALNGKAEDPKMALYAHAHFAGTVDRLSETRTIRYGSYHVRLATVGTDPTIDARFVAN